ncbi:hypothetical protein QY702_03205 [Xanthomonas campestris pv. plantaginis]|uniref:hypothetical protein n=1 Tax=Xanthomonas campestris TaxID=339 RepID=UPI002B23322E|nr:hypothetical protein [Xanthomonas campestris]MEA9605477.1 hypothetical protein [Xanthomonas campestris pv. plantaginis]
MTQSLPPSGTDDAALVARLQALPTQRQPAPQLWENIAAALPPRDTVAALAPRRQRRAWQWPAAGLALAAALGVIAIAPGLKPLPTAPAHATAPPALVMQAQALAGQYQQAIAAVPVEQAPAALLPALNELDRSAQSIHAAIVQSPRSAFLLSQLQRTYAKRLQLTRLAAQGEAYVPS